MGNHTCTDHNAPPPETVVGGESCRYFWAREPFTNLSPFSNTVGWCFKHAVFQYDSDGNMAADAPFPRCAALSSGDKALPIGNPPHDNAVYFWCKALPAMLQTSIHHVKQSLGHRELRLDRLQELLAGGEVDRASVVGIDEREVRQLGPLIEVRHAGQRELEHELGQAVASQSRVIPYGIHLYSVSVRPAAGHIARRRYLTYNAIALVHSDRDNRHHELGIRN